MKQDEVRRHNLFQGIVAPQPLERSLKRAYAKSELRPDAFTIGTWHSSVDLQRGYAVETGSAFLTLRSLGGWNPVEMQSQTPNGCAVLLRTDHLPNPASTSKQTATVELVAMWRAISLASVGHQPHRSE